MNYLKQEFYQILKSDESFFDFIQMNAFDGIWFWNLENPTDKWINPQFCNLLGYEYEELQGNQIQKIVPKEDQLKISNIFDKYVKNTQSVYEDEIRFVHKQGKILWLKVKALIFDETESKQARVLVTHTNITKQHSQEEQLESTSAKYESLLNNYSTFIIRTDMEGNYSYVSDSFCKRLNVDREEIIGTSSMIGIAQEDHYKCITAVHQCIINPKKSAFSNLKKPIFDKKNNQFSTTEFIYTDWEYRAILDNQENITEIQCIGFEVTEKVVAQKALQQKADALAASEEELRLNLEQLQETQHEVVQTKKILQICNEAAQIGVWKLNMIDYSVQWDKIIKDIHEVEDDFVRDTQNGILFYKEGCSRDTITRVLKKAIEEGIPFDEQLKLITAKGNEIWVKSMGIPTFENGKCIEMYGTFQDITQQKQDELQLKEKVEELETTQNKLIHTQKLLDTSNQTAQIGTWELNLNNFTTKWNQITRDIHEAEDDFVSTPENGILFYKEGYSRDTITKVFTRALEKGIGFDEQLKIITAKGNEVWVRTIGIPTFENGKCTELYGTFQDITKQKEAELQFKEKIKELEKAQKEIQTIQNKLTLTLEKTGIGIWELNLITNQLYWDKQTRKMFGLNEHETVDDKTISQNLQVDDNNSVNQMIDDLINRKIAQYHIVYRTIPIDGKVRYHQAKATLMKDEQGNPVSVLGIIQDITQQKEYEKIIEEQNGDLATSENEMRKNIREMYHLQQDISKQKLQLEQIFDAVPAMIYQFKRDNEGNVSFPLVSRGSEIILGVKADEILNNSSNQIFESIHPEDLLGFQTSVKESADTMQKWESELRIVKDEKETWIHATSKPTETDDGGIIWTGIMQNIDHLKETELKVQEKNKQLLETLNELQTTQSQLIHNEKMTTLGQLVASIAHEINTPLGAISSSSSSIEKMLSNTLSNLPKVIKLLSDTELEEFINLIKKSLDNNVTYSAYSAREKRAIKYDLISKFDAKNIAQSDRIADVLVDINVYNEVEIYNHFIELPDAVEILESAYEISTIARSNATIKLATEKAAKIIITLKNFSRQDHTRDKQPANINENLENTLVLYHNQLKYGIEVIRNMEDLPLINIYEDELAQVWTNLLHNAIQAIEKKGKIYLSTKRNENKILVSIRDTGTGIPDEVQSRIFDAFFTTKPAGEGSGLGLNIVKKIVEKHDGKIWFDTINEGENAGTTFFVELPV